MKTVAIVPAGGKGQRFSSAGKKKQFLEVEGTPVVVLTLRALQASSSVDNMVVVVPTEDYDWFGGELPRYGIAKIKSIVPGGEHRQDSVWAGIRAADPDADILMIHDGVRPLVDATLIEETVRAANEYGAALTAIPVADTVKLVDPEGQVARTLRREEIFFSQTPQAFRREIIVEAFEVAYREGFYGTDEASLVERLGVPVKVVPGSYRNFKITTAEDLEYLKFIMARK